jgi:hypothetical protein
VRYWSEPTDWEPVEDDLSTYPPIDGNNVIIKSGWNMIYDLDIPEDGAITYNRVEINGCLTFDSAKNHHFKAYIINLRLGRLTIGTKAKRYTKNAKIELMGDKESESIAIDNNLEAGNKIIVNLGTISIYGKRRSFKMTRLKKPATKGDTTIKIETKNVDLVKGDRIGLAATSYASETGETASVDSYDSNTGIVTLTEPLKDYHYGADESTADAYNGVDIRGEVLSLSRNIKIVGDKVNDHGGQLLTADIFEYDGTLREG